MAVCEYVYVCAFVVIYGYVEVYAFRDFFLWYVVADVDVYFDKFPDVSCVCVIIVLACFFEKMNPEKCV